MIDVVRARYRLAERQADGTTAAEHFAAIARITGKQPAELDALQPPPGGEALLGVYIELERTRRSSGFGPSPLSLTDIDAWIRVHRTPLTSWEIDTLYEMDAAAMRAMSDAARAKSGGKG